MPASLRPSARQLASSRTRSGPGIEALYQVSMLGTAGTMGSMPNSRSLMPFTALVGQEAMKTALVLNAINPGIGGVLIRGQRGTAKSTAVRALARLLPEIDVIAGCRYRCDPAEPATWCDDCRARAEAGIAPVVERRRTRG